MKLQDRYPLAPGYYLEMSTGKVIHIPFPQMGDRRKRYLKLPGFMVMAMGPVLGLLFIICLPVVAIVVVLSLVVRRVLHGFRAGGKAIAGLVTSGRR